MPKQIPFELSPRLPLDPQLFVVHSGVAAAVEQVLGAMRKCIDPPGDPIFESYMICGERGIGKTHLAQYLQWNCQTLGLMPSKLTIFDPESPVLMDEVAIAEYVSKYETFKSSGGIIVFLSEAAAQDLACSPHLLSRLKASQSLMLNPPTEDELPQLIRSLAQRQNLLLDPAVIKYMVENLPTGTLSFSEILASLSSWCFELGKPAKLNSLKKMLAQN